MKPDPIVEEARRAGQVFLDSFNGDLKAAAEELNRRSREAGRNLASPPPPVPQPVKPNPLDARTAR